MPAPEATVVIVTKNRREDLLRAVGTAVAQRPAVEVLVMDDGSTDGTAEAVRDAYTEVRVQRFEESAGYIVRRNQAAALASGPIIVSIDDDAEFPSDKVVAETVAAFDDPRVGAVAMPYVDVPDEQILQRAQSTTGVHLIHRFRGTAYAVRRDLFVKLGGFRVSLVHQAEEGDFCLRMLAEGFVVRLGTTEPVRHAASPTRDLQRIWRYECRNGMLFAWHNVPMPDLVLQLARTTLYLLWLGRGVGKTGLFARALAGGFVEGLQDRSERRPVPRAVWRLYRHLGKRPSTLDDVGAALATSGSAA
jgi:glycosyltransferase involved in cell wall biosynthesis